jgi:sucrose phosphorylase
MKNKVQLITYSDSMGGDLKSLGNLLKDRFQDVFPGGLHILPPFPSTGDRGFAPLTYREIDPVFGTWDDIREISNEFDVMLDVMVNHISRHSEYFRDFVEHGRASQYADMFITLDKVWLGGTPLPGDVKKIFLRKPEHPFLDVEIKETGAVERVWASFGPRVDHSEQVDLDVNSPLTRQFFSELFRFFSERNIKMLRLDAVAYAIKKRGTSCFMVEPEIYEFMGWLGEIAARFRLELLPEVHTHYTTQLKIASHGFWVYDFALPMLILHTLETGRSDKLLDHLAACPRKQITLLDCHDGIPVQPDMDDILTVEESQHLVDLCLERGANLNQFLSETNRRAGFDAHQINITYFDALGRDEDAYLAARAIQFFSPGIPQVYYVGLLAGENDYSAVESTGDGRAVNRKNYTAPEVVDALKKDVVQRLIKLIRFRNQHPAFNGGFSIPRSEGAVFALRWELGDQFCELSMNLDDDCAEITYSNEESQIQRYRA